MSVRVVLPSYLRPLAEGHDELVLDGCASVGEVLAALRETYPAVHARIVTERGEVRPHVNLFVGREDIRWSGGLATPLADGLEVVVLPSVSGG